jgi:hypothetical protein
MMNSKFSIVFSLLIFVHFLASSQSDFEIAKTKGVIELGSDGFNSFVINVDENKNWELVKSQFGKSYLMESTSSNASIIEGLTNYVREIYEVGVDPDDIHFVVSSGAANQNTTASIVSSIEKIGYVVNVVSSEKEGQLAFKSVIPDSQKNETMVIDVGSSNTKISWLELNEIVSISTYGSKYFKNNISDTIVCKALKDVAIKMPKNRTKLVYLIGGMPYKYAKQTRQETERYTKLAPLETYTPMDEKERCGALILKKLQDVGQIEEYIFDWDSNFAIGFLLELPY